MKPLEKDLWEYHTLFSGKFSSDFVFKSQLSTSFLGMSCLYWLSDASSLKAKQKEDFIQFLMNYKGPHKVMVFFDTKTSIAASKSISLVEIKDRYFKVNIADNNRIVEILQQDNVADSLASKRVQEAYESYLYSIKSVVPDVSIDNYLEKLYKFKDEI